MKKLLYTLFVFFIILVNIPLTSSYTDEKNSKQTINYLIKYIDKKIEDLSKISKKYNLNNDKTIKQRIIELEQINDILTKTKKTGQYNEYIKSIVEKLKNNNNLIKTYLKEKIKEKKDEVETNKILFSKKIQPVLIKINDIIVNIASKLMKKEKINSKDKQIIGILILIKNKLNNLENIKDQSFITTKDLRDQIMSNFKQITFHFGQIKNIIKQ